MSTSGHSGGKWTPSPIGPPRLHFLSATRRRQAFFGLGTLALLGCDSSVEMGEAPPTPVVRDVDVCESQSDGLVEGFPRKGAGLCMDQASDVRRYGVGSASPLDKVCVELFNGECELYKSYGLEGVKTLRYVSGGGYSANVNLVASSFRSSAGAYGFFSRRILGDGLPAQVTVRRFEVEGRAVEGIGMAILWRGKQVVELTYIDEEATPKEVEESGPKVLRPLSKLIAMNLVGQKQPARDVRFLEMEGLDELGVLGLSDGVLGVSGSGPATVGFFSKSSFPHRVVVAQRRDEGGGKDLLRVLRRSGVSKKLKGRDIYRVRRAQEDMPPQTWYLRRQGARLLSVGPLGGGGTGYGRLSTPSARKENAKNWEAFAIARLGELSARDAKFE